MDWNVAIEKNRKALKDVLALLVAMTRLDSSQRQNHTILEDFTGAVEKTRTSTGCPTATSTLRVYQFRHDRS